jgi:hypothetical protein
MFRRISLLTSCMLSTVGLGCWPDKPTTNQNQSNHGGASGGAGGDYMPATGGDPASIGGPDSFDLPRRSPSPRPSPYSSPSPRGVSERDLVEARRKRDAAMQRHNAAQRTYPQNHPEVIRAYQAYSGADAEYQRLVGLAYGR